MKKILLYAVPAVLVVAVVIILASGGKKPATQNTDGTLSQAVDVSAQSQDNSAAALLEGSLTDSDGFVRLAGEASRPSSQYVLTGDTCVQFTIPFVESLISKTVYRAAPGLKGADGVCQYFVSQQNPNMMFQLEVGFLNVDNQKAAYEYLGWKVQREPRIPIDNFVVYQENGLINKIFLVLGPEKFMSLDRSAADALSEDAMINAAIKLAGKVKNFK